MIERSSDRRSWLIDRSPIMIYWSPITINKNGDDHDHDPGPRSIVDQSVDRDPTVDFSSYNWCDSTQRLIIILYYSIIILLYYYTDDHSITIDGSTINQDRRPLSQRCRGSCTECAPNIRRLLHGHLILRRIDLSTLSVPSSWLITDYFWWQTPSSPILDRPLNNK